jgi:tetratricopeptide (TPR) repeat protein
LDEFSFFDASLIASGIEQQQQHLNECRQRYDALCDRFREQKLNIATPHDLAVAVLAFLHREILTEKYQIKTTCVDRELTTGQYNCVASTILFRCLSAEFGEVPVVMATPSHVFCRYLGSDQLDVETTCPNWFALPADSDIIAKHPANQPDIELRTLSDVQVLGKLFYNRATDKLDSKEHSTACDLLRTSLVLVPADSAARENLLAALNNWSLQRCEAGDFAQAVQLLTKGAAISPDYVPIQMNDLHVHQQWALDLCRQGQFAKALALLASGHRRRPDVQLFDRGRFAIYGLWADSLFAKGKDAEALQLFDQAARRHSGRSDIRQREVASILRAVQLRIECNHWTQTRQLLEQGLVRQPECSRLIARMRDLTNAKL